MISHCSENSYKYGKGREQNKYGVGLELTTLM